MGYVIFFAIFGLLMYASEEPSKGVPLLILIVGGAVAFFGWSIYTSSDGYKQKKIQEERDNKRLAIQNKMKANAQAIDNVANGRLFKETMNWIKDRNTKKISQTVKNECTYNNKPEARENMLDFTYLDISKTSIRGGSETIVFDRIDFNDLTDREVELLGMAFIKYGKFKLTDNPDVTRLTPDWNYWRPIVQREIDIAYANAVENYRKTHRSIY